VGHNFKFSYRRRVNNWLCCLWRNSPNLP
jgi:hypothetical protein